MSIISADSAHQYWCPFAQVAGAKPNGRVWLGRPPFNRADVSHPDGTKGLQLPTASMCIGEGCMAWRRRVTAEYRDKRPRDEERIGVHTAGGYCGLAGRPE